MSKFWDGERSSMEIAERDTDAGTRDPIYDAYYYEREYDATDEELPEASAFEQWWYSDAISAIRREVRKGEVMAEQVLKDVCSLAFAAGREA